MKLPNDQSSIGTRYRKVLASSLLEAAKLLESDALPLPERIKAVRSNLKRSRALLRLAPKALRARAGTLRRQLSIVRRKLGNARDTQAIVESLGDLKPKGSPRRKSVDQQLFRQWRALLQEPYDKAIRELTSNQIAREVARLRKVAGTLATQAWTNADDQSIIDGFRLDYRRARKRRDGMASKAPEDLHAFRKAAVDHAYQLDFLLPGAAERVARLNALRRKLGSHQDMEMLKSAISDIGEEPGSDRLMKLIKRQQAKSFDRAKVLADELFDSKPSLTWPSDPIFYQAGTLATQPAPEGLS